MPVTKQDFEAILHEKDRLLEQVRRDGTALLSNNDSPPYFFKFGQFQGIDFLLKVESHASKIDISCDRQKGIESQVTRFVLQYIDLLDAELIVFDDLTDGRHNAELYQLSEQAFTNKTNVYEPTYLIRLLDDCIKEALNFQAQRRKLFLINFGSNLSNMQRDAIVSKVKILSNESRNQSYFFIQITRFNSSRVIVDTIPKLVCSSIDFPLISTLECDGIISRINRKVQDEAIAAKKPKLKDDIDIFIGHYENGEDFSFRLGNVSECFHAMIGGQSGKGKTVLLNNIIANGMRSYKKDELQFILLDCKGTEFLEFRNAPKNRIPFTVSSSNIDDLHPIVHEILKIREEREHFLRDEMQCKSIDTYNERYPDKKMPRILIIIDEFQNLFSGSVRRDTEIENILIRNIVKTGRSYGMHLIVCTQTLGDGVKRSFLENIPMRVALGMTASQSTSFLSLRNDAAGNLPRGKAIVNAQNGETEANELVNIQNISESEIQNILANE
jgi:Cdc6-like AAA superfamily ATPase